MFEESFEKLERTLSSLSTPIDIWWRDDDVRAKHVPFYKYKDIIEYARYKRKLKCIVNLLNKHHIPAIFAVIPQNYLEYGSFFTRFFKTKGVFVMLHGLKHVRNMPSGTPASEFPTYKEHDYVEIMQFYTCFQQLFGNQLLNAFCPPYNNINEQLEEKLKEAGLVISSANTPINPPSSYNVDYDFCDWSVYKLKPKEQIIDELCALLTSGKKVIGINSHHSRFSLEDGDFTFFDKVFAITNKSDKIHWINPFISKKL